MSKTENNLVVVGAILGAHGVRGDVRVKSFTAEPADLFSYGALMDEAGTVLIQPAAVKPAKSNFIVKPQDATRQKEDWDALKGTRLYIYRNELPPPEDDSFYIEDMVGLRVLDGDGSQIGTVKAVLNHGASDLIEILPADQSKPVLVPFTLQDVPTLDLQAGTLTVLTYAMWADTSDEDQDGSNPR